VYGGTNSRELRVDILSRLEEKTPIEDINEIIESIMVALVMATHYVTPLTTSNSEEIIQKTYKKLTENPMGNHNFTIK
jgi:hypothetical protein